MPTVGELFGVVKLKGGPKFESDFRRTMGRVKKEVFNLRNAFQGAFGAFLLRDLNREANRATNAMLGLRAVANFKGIQGAPEAIKELAAVKEGLIDASDAAATMQNLILRFNDLETAAQVFDRLSEAAAFNRAQHLSLGEAVRTASEGLKNENSILVDNAGVTKNVSVMWKEYAAQIGKGVMQLTQAEKAEAERLGILKETQPFMGNLTKLTRTAAGDQARFTAELTRTKVQFGLILQSFTPVIAMFSDWLKWLNNSSQSVRNFVAALVVMIVQLKVLKTVIDVLAISVKGLERGLGPVGWMIAGVTALTAAFGFFEAATDRAAASLMKFQEAAESLEMGQLEKEEKKLEAAIERGNAKMKEREAFFKSKGITDNLAAKSARLVADKMIRAERDITATTLEEAKKQLEIIKERQRSIARAAEQGFERRISGLDKNQLLEEEKDLQDLINRAEALSAKWKKNFEEMGTDTAAAQKRIDMKLRDLLESEKQFRASSLAEARERMRVLQERLALIRKTADANQLSEQERAQLQSVMATQDAFIEARISQLEKIGFLSGQSKQIALEEALDRIEADKSLSKTVKEEAQRRIEIKLSEAEALAAIEEDRQQRTTDLHQKAISEEENRRREELEKFNEFNRKLQADIDRRIDERDRKMQASNMRVALAAEDNARQVMASIGNISSAFFSGLQDNAEGMKDFWKAILLEVVNFVEREIVLAKIHAIVKGVMSGGVSLLKDLPLLVAAGGLLQGAKSAIRAMARGGVLTKPEVVLAGEAGPEVYAPYGQFIDFANKLLMIASANTQQSGQRVFEEVVNRQVFDSRQLLSELSTQFGFSQLISKEDLVPAIADSLPSVAAASNANFQRDLGSIQNATNISRTNISNPTEYREGDINMNINFTGPLHDRRVASKLANTVLVPAVKDSRRRERRVVNEDVLRRDR